MAGFSVANFDFGRNLVDANLKRQQMAQQEAQAARQAQLQKRAQDLQAKEAAAQREESARRFDAQNAEEARQFDLRLQEGAAAREEGARQFDENQSLRRDQFEAERADKTRAQAWDDVLKAQEYEKEEQAFQARNAELERIMEIRAREDEERAHQQELLESEYGNAIIVSELSGGFLSPGQIEDFNSRNGTTYNYVGKIDPTTGKPFSDGRIHFVEYNLDENGQAILDEKSGRPTLKSDNAIADEVYGRVMDGYFGTYKNHFKRGGSSGSSLTFDERKELEAQKHAGRMELAGANNASREEIASKRNSTALDLQRMRSDLAVQLREMGLEVDEKKLEEAIRHNKAQEELGERRAQLGEDKLEHNRNRLDNDKAQKEADRQLKRELADARRLASSGKSVAAPSRIKEINAELDALGKVQREGNADARKAARDRVGELMAELKGDKAAIKTGDNTTHETSEKVEPPDGQYNVVKDGVSYHWGRSKSGKWGYFPDK